MSENSQNDKFRTRKRDLLSKQIGRLACYLIMVNAFINLLLRKECQAGNSNRKLIKTTFKYSAVAQS